MRTQISRKHEDETTTLFGFIQILHSSCSCLLLGLFFRNHETFLTNIWHFLWVDKYREKGHTMWYIYFHSCELFNQILPQRNVCLR